MDGETLIGTIIKNRVEEVRVTLGEFKGHPLVSIRIYADYAGDGEGPKPTKKGATVKPALLPELIAALCQAEAEARRRGWLAPNQDSGQDDGEFDHEADRMNPLAAG